MFTRLRPVCSFALTAAVIAVICVGAARRQDAYSHNDAPGYDVFLDSVRAGVLAHVPASPRGGKTGMSRAAVAATTSFVAARSGIAIAADAEARLLALQSEYEQGAAPYVTAGALADAISNWSVDDVLVTATPEEIDRSIESARGFDAPDLPEFFRAGRDRVQVPLGGGSIVASPDEVRAAVTSARTSADTRSYSQTRLRAAVERRLSERLTYLGRADGTRFAPDDLSPVETVALVYSLAANDPMDGSLVDLRGQMAEACKGRTRVVGAPYPRPDGHLPYGPNGYLASTPSPVFMSRVAGLLDRLYR